MPKAGDTQIITKTYMRHKCECCGEPAIRRHAFLLQNARSNPASAGYGKDDISWCADEEAFICNTCPEPKRAGMEWTASFSSARFDHMLHFWHEVSQDIKPAGMTV
jgi:hypothetical protein